MSDSYCMMHMHVAIDTEQISCTFAEPFGAFVLLDSKWQQRANYFQQNVENSLFIKALSSAPQIRSNSLSFFFKLCP